jgi:hypothetical protein
LGKTSSLADIAAIVSDTLTKDNIIVVLTGGGVVTVYSETEYQSDDLDFIFPASSQKLEEAMSQIGFSKEGRYFIHPNTIYYVEFPPSPLMIGEQYIDYAARLAIAL